MSDDQKFGPKPPRDGAPRGQRPSSRGGGGFQKRGPGRPSSKPFAKGQEGHNPRGEFVKRDDTNRPSRFAKRENGNDENRSNRGGFARPDRGFAPKRDFGNRDDRPPRQDRGFAPKREYGNRDERPPHSDRGFAPKRDFGNRDERPPRQDRGFAPKRDFGNRDDRPPRPDRGFAPKRDFGNRDDRPPRPDRGFAPKREYGNRDDRPPRPDRGFAPKREYGNRDDRPPRPDRGFAPKREYGNRDDRPPRPDRGFAPKREYGNRDDRPPRPDRGFAPKRDFGNRDDRPPRPDRGFAPKRDFGNRDDRPPRPDRGFAPKKPRSDKPTLNARQAALKVLLDVAENQAYANISLKNVLAAHSLSPEDKRLASELAYGTLEYQIYLDYCLKRYLRSPIDSVSVLMALRMAAYQLLKLDRIPESAAVNECVNLIREAGQERLTGFANSVLRKLSAEKQDIHLPNPLTRFAEYLSIKHACPEWIVRMWIAELGKEATQALLEAPPQRETCVRPNLLRMNTQEFEAMLTEKEIAFEKGKIDEISYYLSRPGALSEDASFNQGLYSVQGEASIWATRLMGSKPGMHILDACAAPGGKSALMAELSQDQATIEAWDKHPHRVELIKAMMLRLGITGVHAKINNASVITQDEETYDAVLIDAPCSGLGTLDHRVELKLRLQKRDIDSLADEQRSLLEACARRVKPGGVLVYATCTISQEENQKVVEQFLKKWSEFRPDLQPDMLPQGVDPSRIENGGIQLLPHIDGCDGFYVARLVRRA